MALAIFIAVYAIVALANYSVVQSVVGSVVSSHLTKGCGGDVRIGSIGCNPFNHLTLRNILMVHPDGDTVCKSSKIAVTFKSFPFDSHGLVMSRVYLKDTYYHLRIDTVEGINLKYIINYFASSEKEEDEEDDDDSPSEFIVLADDLILDNVTYRQDLKDRRPPEQLADIKGVDVKHMEYQHVKAHFRNVRVDNDFVTCRIDNLTTRERSGLEVREMQMNVYATYRGISATNMILETADSRLVGDVLLDFTSWKSMSEFLDSVVFTCHFKEGSYGGMQDAAYWAHNLWGMDDRVDMCGYFGGPIADFHADSLKLGFGNESVIELDADIYGLPNIDTTIIGASIHRLHTTYGDLASVHLLPGTTLKAESLVKALNNIDLEATFTGTIYDFYATVALQSDPGDLKGDIVLSMDPQKKLYRYVGELKSDGFAMARLAPNKWLSRGAFDLTFEGKGFDPKSMNSSLQGRIHDIVVKGQRISSDAIVEAEAVGGVVKADVKLDDTLARFDAHGEMEWRDDNPVYRTTLDVARIDLVPFGLWNDSADASAVASLRFDGRYVTMKEGNGFLRLSINDANLVADSRNLHLNSMVLSAREQNYWKNVNLRSDLLTAQMRGYFNYDGIVPTFKHFVASYLPDYKQSGKSADNDYDRIADARFEFNAELHDTNAILQQFLPQLMVANGTTIQANYNFEESYKPIVRADSLGWGGVKLYNVGLNGESLADHYRLRLTADEMLLGGVKLADYADLVVESSPSNTLSRLYWENSSQSVGGGDVNLRLLADTGICQLIIDPSHLALGGEQWSLSGQGGDIYATPDGFSVDGLLLSSGDKRLLLNASRFGAPEDSVEVLFVDFGLGVINPFTGGALDVEGEANGNVKLHYSDQHAADEGTSSGGARVDEYNATMRLPFVNADLQIADLRLNGEPLGDAKIRSVWNVDKNNISLFVNTERMVTSGGVTTLGEPIQVVGGLDLSGDEPVMDFHASFEALGLRLAEPYVSSFSSQIAGDLYGDFDIHGTFGNPVLEGNLYVDGGMLMVDFLNVPFFFTDTIHADGSSFRLNNFKISDSRGNPAFVNGVISHQGFKDFSFDLAVHSDKLLCMNTTSRQSESYYGTVVASVDGTVTGLIDDIRVALDARTLSGTVLNIPINDKRQLKQADYIHFVSDHDDYAFTDESVSPSSDQNRPTSPTTTPTADNRFSLTIDIDATQDMEVRIPMDFSSVSLDVRAKGDGALQLQVGSNNPFALLGDYEMSGGTVLLDLLGVLSKEFNIDEGSSITFPGAVSDALFDIKAVYPQRVNLSTLTGLTSTESQKPIQVENIIALSGTLQSPDINFDLRLPSADQSVQEEVFAYIDRSNEREMLNQTVSLLLFKKFYNGSLVSSEQASNTAESGGVGLVANTLGGVVSDMVQFVDINFDYQAGNDFTTEQYAVDISKEWNKFYFETSLGFGGESREMSTINGNNNMTGDMLVGYKINPKLHLFVFNRSNTNDYTRSDLPYKQGIGVKYTRDFDKIGELFRRK